MDVTVDNFASVIDPFRDALSTATYVSIDLEMSGLQLNQVDNGRFGQPPSLRYKEMRAGVEHHNILQVGITLSKECKTPDGTKIEHTNYNFHLCPDVENRLSPVSAHPNGPTLGHLNIKAENIQFLLNNNISCDTAMRSGIPWVRSGASSVELLTLQKDRKDFANRLKYLLEDKQDVGKFKLALKHKWKTYLESRRYNPNYKVNTSHYTPKIKSWFAEQQRNGFPTLSHGKPQKIEIMSLQDRCTTRDELVSNLEQSFIDLMKEHQVFLSFEDYYNPDPKLKDTTTTTTKDVPHVGPRGIVVTLYPNEENYQKYYIQPTMNQINQDFNQMWGFGNIWQLLTTHHSIVGSGYELGCRVPVVMHNAMYDLMFLYHKMEGQLPDDHLQFIAAINRLFPHGVYDTQYIVDHHLLTRLPRYDVLEAKVLQDGTRLNKLFHNFLALHWKAHGRDVGPITTGGGSSGDDIDGQENNNNDNNDSVISPEEDTLLNNNRDFIINNNNSVDVLPPPPKLFDMHDLSKQQQQQKQKDKNSIFTVSPFAPPNDDDKEYVRPLYFSETIHHAGLDSLMTVAVFYWLLEFIYGSELKCAGPLQFDFSNQVLCYEPLYDDDNNNNNETIIKDNYIVWNVLNNVLQDDEQRNELSLMWELPGVVEQRQKQQQQQQQQRGNRKSRNNNNNNNTKGVQYQYIDYNQSCPLDLMKSAYFQLLFCNFAGSPLKFDQYAWDLSAARWVNDKDMLPNGAVILTHQNDDNNNNNNKKKNKNNDDEHHTEFVGKHLLPQHLKLQYECNKEKNCLAIYNGAYVSYQTSALMRYGAVRLPYNNGNNPMQSLLPTQRSYKGPDYAFILSFDIAKFQAVWRNEQQLSNNKSNGNSFNHARLPNPYQIKAILNSFSAGTKTPETPAQKECAKYLWFVNEVHPQPYQTQIFKNKVIHYKITASLIEFENQQQQQQQQQQQNDNNSGGFQCPLPSRIVLQEGHDGRSNYYNTTRGNKLAAFILAILFRDLTNDPLLLQHTNNTKNGYVEDQFWHYTNLISRNMVCIATFEEFVLGRELLYRECSQQVQIDTLNMMIDDDNDSNNNNNTTNTTTMMYNPTYQLQYETSQWFTPSKIRHVAEQERLAIRMALQTLAMKLYTKKIVNDPNCAIGLIKQENIKIQTSQVIGQNQCIQLDEEDTLKYCLQNQQEFKVFITDARYTSPYGLYEYLDSCVYNRQ